MAGILTAVERFAIKRGSIADFTVRFKKSELLSDHHFPVENEHEKFKLAVMNKCPACLRRPRIPAWLAGLAGSIVFPLSVFASQADFQLAEGLADPVPFEISERAEKVAEAHACYMQAIFDEDLNGPDMALESKKRVLALDPGFCALALDVAQHHLRRGETTEALSILKDATKASPQNPSAPIALANIYLHYLEKPILAERFAALAQDVDPANSTSYEILWEVYHATGQKRKIESLFQKALKFETKNPAFWLDLADLRLRETKRSKHPISPGAWEKILTLVDRAAKADEKNPEILSRTADYYFACGDAASAAELYKQAIAARPSLAGMKEKLAECYVFNGDNAAATALLEKVVAENPMNLAAYDQLARLHIQQNEPAKALSKLRQALLIAPIEPRRYEEIIRIALRAGDEKNALQYADEAEQRFPYLTGFTLLRAISLSQSKQHAAALMAFERTLIEASNSNPELLDGTFYMAYGAAAEQAGHYTKAAELIKMAISLEPNNAEPYNFLAYMWADRGENLEAACELVGRALELEPGNGAYIDTLGWIYFRQGRYAEAVSELLRAAANLEKPDPVVLEHIGDAYEKLGKTTEALMYWQKAHGIDPKNPTLAEKIDQHSSKVAKQPDAQP
jgi:tetratricopeptide (TPR) repeat protein